MSPKSHILIVDSDKNFTDALVERLKTCEYLTAGITSGAQLFQIVNQFKPNMIIVSTDLQNPTWTDLLDRIKHSSLFKDKPTTLLLCRDMTPGLESQAKLHDITKILLKPVRFNELIEVIEKIT